MGSAMTIDTEVQDPFARGENVTECTKRWCTFWIGLPLPSATLVFNVFSLNIEPNFGGRVDASCVKSYGEMSVVRLGASDGEGRLSRC